MDQFIKKQFTLVAIYISIMQTVLVLFTEVFRQVVLRLLSTPHQKRKWFSLGLFSQLEMVSMKKVEKLVMWFTWTSFKEMSNVTN